MNHSLRRTSSIVLSVPKTSARMNLWSSGAMSVRSISYSRGCSGGGMHPEKRRKAEAPKEYQSACEEMGRVRSRVGSEKKLKTDILP